MFEKSGSPLQFLHLCLSHILWRVILAHWFCKLISTDTTTDLHMFMPDRTVQPDKDTYYRTNLRMYSCRRVWLMAKISHPTWKKFLARWQVFSHSIVYSHRGNLSSPLVSFVGEFWRPLLYIVSPRGHSQVVVKESIET